MENMYFGEVVLMKKALSSYIELTGAMVIVGSVIVVSKMITAGFPVFLAAALRFGLASPILLVMVWKSARGFPRVERRDLLVIFLQSLAGNFLYSIFLLYGLKLTSAAESGIISGTVPAIVGVISFLFLRERLSWSKWLGIALVVMGMIVINEVGSGGEHGTGNWLGNLLIVGSAAGEALWTVLSKANSGKVAPLTIACLTSCFGFLLFLPIALCQSIEFNFAAVSLAGWGVIIYYGLVGTVAAYCLWYQGVAKVSAGTAGVFTGIAPVSAVVLSYIVLGEPFAWSHILGGLCVLLAIVLITRSSQTASSFAFFKVCRPRILANRHVIEQPVVGREHDTNAF
jgi:drug/metabolite transporter (DMT)-like permease